MVSSYIQYVNENVAAILNGDIYFHLTTRLCVFITIYDNATLVIVHVIHKQ